MALPFEKNDKRRWQCFVCGLNYNSFEEFKNHIIEKHEEGREYIPCPKCGSPVRDVKAHWKVFHKNDSLPKTGMMKAIVWKDHSNTGKLKHKKPRFRDGYFISQKNGGKEMHYRSGFECEVYEVLELIPEIISYAVEPFKNGIPYQAPDGTAHKYFPDLSLQFNDSHVEIWEIKPAAQTGLELNECKWKSANLFCEAHGWTFTVVTEVGLNKLKKRVMFEKALNET